MSDVYGRIAGNDDPDAMYHIPDDRGSNEPFHPVARCGMTLDRQLTDDLPKDATVCKSCSGQKTASTNDIAK